MKITVKQLRSIIKEEVQKVLLEYEQMIVRRGDDLFVTDDEGNESWYSEVEDSDYENLRDGETAELSGGTSPSFSTQTRGGYYAHKRY